VATSDPVRVIVEIQRADDTVSGQLTVDGHATAGFFGWLELIDLLRRASDASGSPAAIAANGGDGSVGDV